MYNMIKILKLIDIGYSQRQISRETNCSRDTIRKIQNKLNSISFDFELINSSTNEELYKIIFPKSYENNSSIYEQLDLEYLTNELPKKGVTKKLLCFAM